MTTILITILILISIFCFIAAMRYRRKYHEQRAMNMEKIETALGKQFDEMMAGMGFRRREEWPEEIHEK